MTPQARANMERQRAARLEAEAARPAPRKFTQRNVRTDMSYDHLWFILLEAAEALTAEAASVAYAKRIGSTGNETNNIAPLFTQWKALGIVKVTGRLPTDHGKPASAFVLTQDALTRFVARYHREPYCT